MYEQCIAHDLYNVFEMHVRGHYVERISNVLCMCCFLHL